MPWIHPLALPPVTVNRSKYSGVLHRREGFGQRSCEKIQGTGGVGQEKIMEVTTIMTRREREVFNGDSFTAD